MQDIKDVNELERRPSTSAPGLPPGAGFVLHRDPPVREVATRLIAAGSVERNEINDGTDGVTRSR